MTAGLTPKDASEVNNFVGSHLRAFVSIQETIGHDNASLAPLDLKVDPYNMSAEDEATIKTAISGLHTSLQGVDRTFIDRLIGLF